MGAIFGGIFVVFFLFFGGIYVLSLIAEWLDGNGGTNTSSVQTSSTSDKTEHSQNNETTKSNSETHSPRYGCKRRDYKEVLRNYPPIGNAKAGFINDAKKQLFDGGAFWHIDDLVRHIGGKTTTYLSYDAKIKNAWDAGYTTKVVKTLLEAMEYARQKEDVSRYFGYRYMFGQLTDEFEDRVETIAMMIDYCLIQEDDCLPRWMYEKVEPICNDFYTYLSSIDRNTTDGAGMILFFSELVEFYEIVAKKADSRDFLEIAFFYRGLIVFMTKGTLIPGMYENRHKIFSDIKESNVDFDWLKSRWKKEGVPIDDI